MVKRKIVWITVVTVCLFAVVALRVFVGEVCAVPSWSMSPTIVAGDWLWIDKMTYGARLPRRFADIPIINVFTWVKPLRLADEKNDWGHNRMKGLRMPQMGDLAVFESPEYPHPLLVKRISALFRAGDTIVVNAHTYNDLHHIVCHEGKEIFLRNDSVFINGQPDSLCILTQPYYCMLGDNRENSHDSRAFGYVPYSSIVGRMNLVLFSINTDKGFFNKIRWNRFFKIIH